MEEKATRECCEFDEPGREPSEYMDPEAGGDETSGKPKSAAVGAAHPLFSFMKANALVRNLRLKGPMVKNGEYRNPGV